VFPVTLLLQSIQFFLNHRDFLLELLNKVRFEFFSKQERLLELLACICEQSNRDTAGLGPVA